MNEKEAVKDLKIDQIKSILAKLMSIYCWRPVMETDLVVKQVCKKNTLIGLCIVYCIKPLSSGIWGKISKTFSEAPKWDLICEHYKIRIFSR